MSGANGGRVKSVKEPSRAEIEKYFNESNGPSRSFTTDQRKITVIAKPENSATNTIILSVESLLRPGSNNKMIYKSFSAPGDMQPDIVWKRLQNLDDQYKEFVLLYDDLWKSDDTYYAKMAACRTDGFQQASDTRLKSIIDIWKRGSSNQNQTVTTRSAAQTKILKNFEMLEETVDAIHKLELTTLDIKPENLFFECGIVKRFVLADLDAARVTENQQVVGTTSDYTNTGLNAKNNDKFALYISFIEILAPTFFRDFFPAVNTETGYNPYIFGNYLGRFNSKKGGWGNKNIKKLQSKLQDHLNDNMKADRSLLSDAVSFKNIINKYIEKIGSLESEYQAEKEAEEKAKEEPRMRHQAISDIFASPPPSDDDDDLIKTLRNKLKF